MPLSSCRECSHPVSTEARFCPQCGIPRPVQPDAGGVARTEHASVPPQIPGSGARHESGAPLGSAPALIGLAGVALLSFGVFAPFLSVPIVGSLTYFQNGKGDGMIILALAAVAGMMILAGGLRWLILPGLGSLALLTYVYFTFQSKISEMRAEMASQDLGMFSGLGEMMMQSVQLQWGFGLLVIGALLVTVAGVIAPRDDGAVTRDFSA